MPRFKRPIRQFGRIASGGGNGHHSSGPLKDASFTNVKLLLSGEGADASTTFTDLSSAAHGNATVVASTQVDTAQFKFGAASILFNGTTDCLQYASHADWLLGANPFCIEMWIRPDTIVGDRYIIARYNPATAFCWVFRLNGTALTWNMGTGGGSLPTSGGDHAGGLVAANAWQHVAEDFDGTKYRMFLDGVMVASSTTLITIPSSSEPLTIGANSAGNLKFFSGWMDEPRFTLSSRYGSDTSFTPPTAAFPRS